MGISSTLVHLFLPHHTNNHRSRALHLDALLLYVLLFALFNLGLRTLHRTMPDVLGYATDIRLDALLADTNARRQAAGLGPLTLNSTLSSAAAGKAQDMFAKNYWAHNSPAGATPWDFISGAGYKYVVAGENLAKNFSTSGSVVDAWMASPSHRDNLLKASYQEVGFAIVNGVLNGEETTLVVQMFGTPPASVAQAPAPAAPILLDTAIADIETKVEAAEPTQAPALSQPPVASAPPQYVASAFDQVTKKPIVNIPTITRDFVFIFAGVLMGVLVLDAWIISRRKVVRVAGHNITHALFLLAIVIAAGSVARGSLL